MNDTHTHDRDERDAGAIGGEALSDEALVTAYALGELEGSEHAAARARVEALAARDAGVRDEIERIRDVGDDLRREFFLENRMAAPTLSAEQHGAIERELAGPAGASPAARPSRPWLLPTWTLAAAGLAAVALVIWQSTLPGEGAAAPADQRRNGLVAMADNREAPERLTSLGYLGTDSDTGAPAPERNTPAPDESQADSMLNRGDAAAGKAVEPTVSPSGQPSPFVYDTLGQASERKVDAPPASVSEMASQREPLQEPLGALGYVDGSAAPSKPAAGAATPVSHLSGGEKDKWVKGGIGAAAPGPAAPVAPAEPAVPPSDGADDRREPDHLIYRRVQPVPGTESYAPIVEQGFASPIREPLSTFSIDVDTASYANVRRFLNNGQLPPLDAVRIEELINYFEYDYPAPDGETPFATHVVVTECPWARQHRLVRIGIKGREVAPAARAASNLVFLLDVSGSMNQPDKLPLLVASMKLLVQQLDERDRVAVVVYAGAAGLRLEPTTCDAAGRAKVAGVLDGLAAGGSTAGAAGIELAYQTAKGGFIQGGTNRVILATDGDFNVGITDRESLQRLIEQSARSGVFLSVLGFGEGNLKDGTAELLADKGNGNYSYIDSLDEGRRVLVREMGGTLVTIAKDVKIQVEFNPAQVGAYRLIGYENRALAAQDFNDDRKDAGEIGAGHTVTALYEIVPVGLEGLPGVDALKYQSVPAAPAPELTGSPDLLTVKLRWKRPEADTSSKLELAVLDQGGTLAQAGPDASFSAAVAAFGMLLRGSGAAGDASWASVRELAQAGRGADADGYRAEFIRLVQVAEGLSAR